MEAFKERLNEASAKELADAISSVWPEFDAQRFLSLATSGLDSLEMKERMLQFTTALIETLPENSGRSIGLLVRALPPPQLDCNDLNSSWCYWAVGEFIAQRGIDDYDVAMPALRELTMRFTAEFAVRPLAERYPEQVLADLLRWTGDENPHVRRWCSEGVRPLLPWGQKLHALVDDPAPLIPILDALHRDPELYVRRSVANNLNDIAKHHPEVVVDTCRRWLDAGRTKELNQLVRHALRTLIKTGYPPALALLGYAPLRDVSADFVIESETVAVGDALRLSLCLKSRCARDQPLIIDFAIHYLRKNGLHNRKVFKWSTTILAAGGEGNYEKSHSFREVTTRRLYPGQHRVELLINGESLGEREFILKQSNEG